MPRCFVTTTDNPFNHFTQYEEWKDYDENACGYYTEAYFARIGASSPELSPDEMMRDDESVCDEICAMDLRYISPVTGKEVAYVKVVEDEQ